MAVCILFTLIAVFYVDMITSFKDKIDLKFTKQVKKL